MIDITNKGKQLEQRRIPNTQLDVSPICLGTMTFGTPVAKADAIRIVHWALDHGLNFIDTADMYEGYDRSATGQLCGKVAA